MFDKLGIRFQYPENWQVVDENLMQVPQAISLQSPGGGFWSLMQYARGTDSSSLLRETLDQMRAEYPGLESSVVVEQFDDVSATGYEMFFYCLDFLIAARSFVLKGASGAVMLLLWQAEDREFTQHEPVFRAMTTSLLREAAARGPEPDS